MSYALNEQHLRNAMKLDAPHRYGYFIKRAADWQELWGLKGPRGFVLAMDDDGVSLLPIWPHESFAQLSATGDWADSKPELIGLAELLDEWIPRLHREGHLLAVFPLANGTGIHVDPLRVAEDLSEECSKMEG